MSDVKTLFIKFKGIPGTANLDGYEDYIPIDSVNFSTFANVKPDSSGVLSSGGVNISAVSFSKTDDFNSDELLSTKMLNTESFSEVIIVKVTTNNDKIVVNKKITMNDVCILSAETNLLDSTAATNHYTFVTSSLQRESSSVAKDGKTNKIGPNGFNFVTGKKQ